MTAAQFDIAFALISQIYRVVAETRSWMSAQREDGDGSEQFELVRT